MGVKTHSPAEIDMTPMIDCVFQLIIFFIVTVNLEKNYREDIILADAPRAPQAEEDDERGTMVIEVDSAGAIWMLGSQLDAAGLDAVIRHRFNRMGEFPVLIRADYRTRHMYVRTVMDVCSAAGLYKLQFAGIKEHQGE
jgi:biopolymer transport protein ExbD